MTVTTESFTRDAISGKWCLRIGSKFSKNSFCVHIPGSLETPNALAIQVVNDALYQIESLSRTARKHLRGFFLYLDECPDETILLTAAEVSSQAEALFLYFFAESHEYESGLFWVEFSPDPVRGYRAYGFASCGYGNSASTIRP